MEILWASDEINARPSEYWLRVMDIARRNNVPRIVRCCTIMGRSETEELSAAQIFYPCMQAADIFFRRSETDAGALSSGASTSSASTTGSASASSSGVVSAASAG